MFPGVSPKARRVHHALDRYSTRPSRRHVDPMRSGLAIADHPVPRRAGRTRRRPVPPLPQRSPASRPRGTVRRRPGASSVPLDDCDTANGVAVEPGMPGRSHHEKPGFDGAAHLPREAVRRRRASRRRKSVSPHHPTLEGRKTGETCCHVFRPSESLTGCEAVSTSKRRVTASPRGVPRPGPKECSEEPSPGHPIQAPSSPESRLREVHPRIPP